MKSKAKAVSPFKSNDDPSFFFNEDEVLLITDQDDKGWYNGSINGKTGWFPASFVEIIESDSDNANKDTIGSRFSTSLRDLLGLSVSISFLTACSSHQTGNYIFLKAVIFLILMKLQMILLQL
jgi:hypothetical protein